MFESLFTSDSKQNQLKINPVSITPRSFVSCAAGGGCEGEWRAGGNSFPGMAAHETGHILRLDDQYKSDGSAQPGYMGNLMGPRVGPSQGFGDVWPQDIQQVIQNEQGGWQRVPHGPHEPGADGGFLLYPNKPNTNMMAQVYSK